MAADLTLRLADGFAAPTRQDWLALVQRSLKGEPFDSLVSRTADGMEIEPLYTSADATGHLVRRPVDPAQPWDVRTTVDQPDPAAANSRVLEELEGGATSVLLSVSHGAADGGCAIETAEQMELALSGVVLEAAAVALDAGLRGPDAAEWLSQAAHGSPSAKLAFHLDPIGAFAQTGATSGPVDAHIEQAAIRAVRLAPAHPRASLFLASGQVAHEAGGSEAQELGLMACSLLAYAKALDQQGLAAQEAFGRIVLGLAVDADYFVSMAKVRAARLIGARIVAACGLSAHEHALTIEVRSSRRMLTRVDAWTNLLRLTAAGFAAAAGGADAVVLAPFTQAIGAPTPLARRQARNTQLLLMQEAHMGRVLDPAAGAWFVEAFTERLAREGWAMFQAMERQGGAVVALASGYLASNVDGARAALAAAAERRGVLGVTRFPNPDEHPAPTQDGLVARRAADPRLPGADSACPPLQPMRVSEPFENFDGALT